MNNALLDPSIIYLRTVNSDELNRNCKENNFEKVKEIIESKENFTPTNTHLVLALENQNIEMFNYIFKKRNFHTREYKNSIYPLFFELTINLKNLEFTKVLLNMLIESKCFNSKNILKFLHISIQSRNTEILNWIIENCKDTLENADREYIPKLLFEVTDLEGMKMLEKTDFKCKIPTEGDIELVNKIYEKYDNINLSVFDNKILYDTCNKRKLHTMFTAEWLIDRIPNFDISMDNFKLIKQLIKRGNVEFIDRIFKKYSDKIDLCMENNELLSTTLSYRNLGMANWLLENAPNMVVSEDIFCRIMPLDFEITVTRWLFQKNPNVDITHRNHYIFKSVCESNYLDLAEFLCDKYDFYRVITDDNDIIVDYHIKETIKYTKEVEIECEEECCVCFEKADTLTSCGHYGCLNCFNNIFSNDCPLCRQKINEYYKIVNKTT